MIMPLPRRFLQSVASVEAPPPEPATVDSDIVVILAALLCALICVVGLALVARCAWLRRSSSSPASRPSPPPPLPNKGLKKKVLRSLPKLSFHQAFSSGGKLSPECPICLAEFADGDEIRILPQCGHGFHVACVDTWLKSHSSCPSCRQILVAASSAAAEPGAGEAAAAASGSGGCASTSRCRRCGASGEEVEVGPEEAAAVDDVEAKARDDGDAGRFQP